VTVIFSKEMSLSNFYMCLAMVAAIGFFIPDYHFGSFKAPPGGNLQIAIFFLSILAVLSMLRHFTNYWSLTSDPLKKFGTSSKTINSTFGTVTMYDFIYEQDWIPVLPDILHLAFGLLLLVLCLLSYIIVVIEFNQKRNAAQ